MRRILMLIALLVFAANVWSQEKELKLPEGLPPAGPLEPFSSPSVQQEKLPNGLTVWLLPRAGFPKVTFLFTARGGFAADPQDRPGISEFLANALNQGTKTRTAKQIAEQIQASGGELRIEPSPEAISVETTVLAFRASQALDVVADLVQNASFPSAQIEIVRAGLGNSLQRRQVDPAFLARRGLMAAIFGKQPYAVVAPTQATVSATTVSDLQMEYARRFRPENTMLLVIGDFQAPAMLGAIRLHFGSWHVNGKDDIPAVPPLQQQAKGTLTLIPRANSVQTRFMMAALGPAEGYPDYAAAHVAVLVCGRRISRNVREDKGYAYSAGSDTQSVGRANLLLTAAAVRNPVTGATWNELRYELDRMAVTSPTPGELDRAKHFLIGYEALGLQSQAALAERLGTLWSIGLGPEQIGKESEAVGKVSAADVDRIGRELLVSSQITAVAVGDGNSIEQQLAPLRVDIKRPQQ